MRDTVHVLIVEDEAIVALHLRQQLGRLGYAHITDVRSGQKALDVVRDNPPDLILMDIRIGGDIDGIETAASIAPDLMIPVIYLSAYSEDSTLERARATRPYGYLLKPFSERELHATIQMALERRAVEMMLRETRDRLSLAMHTAHISCWEVDVATRKMHYTGIDKFVPDQVQETTTISGTWDEFLERVATEDRDMVRKTFEYAVLNGDFYDIVFRGAAHSDQLMWYRARGRSYHNQTTGMQRIVGILQDITDQRITNEKLRQAMTVFETTEDGILILDPSLKVISANRAFCQITGANAQKITGQVPTTLLGDILPGMTAPEQAQFLHGRHHWHREVDSTTALGHPIAIIVQIIAVEDDDHSLTHFVAMVSDRTAIRQAENELHYLAHYDGLTGLPNRLLATDRLGRAIERSERSGEMVCCLFIDLDDFKHINDTLGHAAGDQLLLIAANRMKSLTERTDTLARLGGDEFLIVCERFKTETDVTGLATRIIGEMQRPFHILGQELRISASIGISLYPDHGNTAQDLIRLADTAMYAAKDQGRRAFAFYKTEMTESATHYMTRSLELRRGLEHDELVLFYQPQIDARGGNMTGVEALIRWKHPRCGLLGPMEIIPVAEQSGLIVEIGRWVLNEACQQLARWQKAGHDPLTMAVNVSVRQLRSPDFAQTVRDAIENAGIDAKWLELEITESMIQDEDIIIDMLGALRDIGVSLAIDDFGTGYSCLRSIKRLPIERIKIDRAFIKGVTTSSDDAALAGAMVAMARTLGLAITAEGVETEEQAAFLVQLGCSNLQGFLFSRPIPADDVFAQPDKAKKLP